MIVSKEATGDEALDLGRGVWLLWMALGLLPANAYDLPLGRMVNGLVKAAPRQADFVVRLDLLRGVPFPLAGTTTK
jgi:hypothetical protein